jgi:hypothetical protein
LDTEELGPTSHPGQRATRTPKSIGLYEAIEPHTIAIIPMLFGVEFYRPGLIYMAIYILMRA